MYMYMYIYSKYPHMYISFPHEKHADQSSCHSSDQQHVFIACSYKTYACRMYAQPQACRQIHVQTLHF